MNTLRYQLRKPREDEVEAIHQLLAPLADEELILPRSRDDIHADLSQFVVAVTQEDAIIGCASLYDFGMGLQEIRSLAVSEKWEGYGVGSALVRNLLDQSKDNGARRLFVLTLRPRLFRRHGFKEVSMTSLPEKVWKDCQHCPKREHCDEIALLLEL